MDKRTITMFQLMECFADIAPDCQVTLINVSNGGSRLHKYHISNGICESLYVDLSKPHTLPEWCSIFDGFDVCFDNILVRYWSIKSLTKTKVPMVDKMAIFIKE